MGNCISFGKSLQEMQGWSLFFAQCSFDSGATHFSSKSPTIARSFQHVQCSFAAFLLVFRSLALNTLRTWVFLKYHYLIRSYLRSFLLLIQFVPCCILGYSIHCLCGSVENDYEMFLPNDNSSHNFFLLEFKGWKSGPFLSLRCVWSALDLLGSCTRSPVKTLVPPICSIV